MQAAFSVPLQSLHEVSPDAATLLNVLAYFDPESIPVDILTRGAQKAKSRPAERPHSVQKLTMGRKIKGKLPWRRSKLLKNLSNNENNSTLDSLLPSTSLFDLICSKESLREAMTLLEKYSLAQPVYGDHPSLHIHDLIQLILQKESTRSNRYHECYALAVTLLTSAFETIEDPDLPHSWAECESLVPHLVSLGKHRPASLPASLEFLLMNENIAYNYFHSRGRFSEAEVLLSRVIEQREKAAGVGPDHRDTLRTLRYLARVLIDRGNYDQAEILLAQALAGQEKQLGADHNDTLATSYELAGLYLDQHKHDQAEKLFVRVLAGQEAQLGAEHLSTLKTVESLAHVYSDQGKHDAAKTLYERVLAGREKQLSPEHPDILMAMSSLGELYRKQGKLDEAEALLARVFCNRETVLGAEHPDTLNVTHNLASLYNEQGKYDEAETLYERVLAGDEKQLGMEHPGTLATVHNFAFLREKQGRWEDAEKLYQRALAGQEKVRGRNHSNTMATVKCLARFYDRQGRDEEAEVLWARSREIESQAN